MYVFSRIISLENPKMQGYCQCQIGTRRCRVLSVQDLVYSTKNVRKIYNSSLNPNSNSTLDLVQVQRVSNNFVFNEAERILLMLSHNLDFSSHNLIGMVHYFSCNHMFYKFSHFSRNTTIPILITDMVKTLKTSII